jgi:H+/Cl- antiporter ClcA
MSEQSEKVGQQSPPWWDWLVPVSFVVGSVAGAVLWTQWAAPQSYEGFWPVLAVISGFITTAIFVENMRSITDD